jgi:hypothetical protein
MSLPNRKSILAAVAVLPLLCASSVSPAFAQDPAHGKDMREASPQAGRSMSRMGSHMRHGPGTSGYHGGSGRAMLLAGHLSAIETAIGIKSSQLDAWRDFTSQLVSFADRTGPMTGGGDAEAPDPSAEEDAGPDAMGDERTAPPRPSAPDEGAAESEQTQQTVPDQDQMATPEAGDTATDTAATPFGRLTRLADRAIARGEQAKRLKEAMSNLEAVLTPEQSRELARRLRSVHVGWRGVDRSERPWRDHRRDERERGPRRQ